MKYFTAEDYPKLYPPDERMGVAIPDAKPELTYDMMRELGNKIAWAIGSTYRVPYRSKHSEAVKAAGLAALQVLDHHGYPAHIRKDT